MDRWAGQLVPGRVTVEHPADPFRTSRAEQTGRQRCLTEAARIVSSDRNRSYGEPEANLGRIADLWTVLFGRKVTARQVAWAMALVKIAREVNAPHPDNPVDVAGYAACAAEL
jgi:hypothetical protein